jgi:transcriptional regulator with XRE-family HTH domain
MFYGNIQQLCKRNNVSISAVLNELDISKSAIQRWKQGGLPTAGTIKSIARYFEVSVDDLLGNEQKEKAPNALENLDPAEQNIFNKIKQLNGIGINRLDAYIDGLLASDDYRNDAAREATAQNKSA